MYNLIKKLRWKLLSSFLRSSKVEGLGYKPMTEFKKTKEVDFYKIPTYPRFTIICYETIIFDSSDPEVINYAFNSFKFSGTSISIDKKITFRDSEYEVINIKVDILDIFDDYSFEFILGGRHTPVYEGWDVPYNIQITIQVK